jgi:predicted phosphodiesterase
MIYKENLRFRAEEVNVWITHIGGTPAKYADRVRSEIYLHSPDLFICGHSHIAKIMYDKKGSFLYVNPGAAGFIGFHKIMTVVRFSIDGKEIHNMELIELGERGRVSI